MDISIQDLWMILPLLIITGLAFVVLLFDTLVRPSDKSVLTWLCVVGLGVTAVVCAFQWAQLGAESHALFGGHITIDRYGLFFNEIFLAVCTLGVLISKDYLDREEINTGEYYALLMFALLGMMLLSVAGDLMMIFVGIELMSVPVYVLAAFNRSNYLCIEGALKYFILGAFASGFLLFGIALLYGAAGTTNLDALRSYLASLNGANILVTTGIGMLLVGFGFKVAAVPFHMWAPDVYEGAATPVTAIMATGVKAGAFAGIIRTFIALSPAQEISHTNQLIWVIAALTIVIGNVAAIRQSNIKRMLAYSSVGHSGYLLMGLLALGPGGSYAESGTSALLYYLAAYVFMNIGAFAIIIVMGRKEREPLEVDDWAGLGFKHPWLGASMALFMFSLGGLPPTSGFFAKFYLFSSVVDAGYTNIVILAVLTSAASFYYYLRVVVVMYMQPSTDKWSPGLSRLSTAVITMATVAVLWMGILPSGPVSFLHWARASVAALI